MLTMAPVVCNLSNGAIFNDPYPRFQGRAII